LRTSRPPPPRACRSENAGIYFVGNGGSAAEAKHLATELVGTFALDRTAMRGGALTASAVVLTALVNDYSADELFARRCVISSMSGTAGRAVDERSLAERNPRARTAKSIGCTRSDSQVAGRQSLSHVATGLSTCRPLSYRGFRKFISCRDTYSARSWETRLGVYARRALHVNDSKIT
jgi:hypothetical protein